MKSYIVDSFTKEPFKGNPAGVCLVGHELSEDNMLKIVQEFGLSETAFVKQTSTTGVYKIRYFSPKKEIPLCGHATLAAARIILQDAGLAELHFITSGKLDLRITRRGDEIVMEFPVYDTVAATVSRPMLVALGLKTVDHTAFSAQNKIILLEIRDDRVLAGLTPDFKALLSSHDNINGVLVTAPSRSVDYDFHYRYFWPWAGTDEDPVTGGVQTFLAKYWANKLGKKKMKAFQSSARTGHMTVELQEEKVLVIGSAVIVLEGDMLSFAMHGPKS